MRGGEGAMEGGNEVWVRGSVGQPKLKLTKREHGGAARLEGGISSGTHTQIETSQERPWRGRPPCRQNIVHVRTPTLKLTKREDGGVAHPEEDDCRGGEERGREGAREGGGEGERERGVGTRERRGEGGWERGRGGQV